MGRKAYGICLGASTISAVEVTMQANQPIPILSQSLNKPHEGNPHDCLLEVLGSLDCGKNPILITGRKFRNYVQLRSITEPEAAEYALRFVSNGNDKFDALVSAGGETFMVYLLDPGYRITGISTGNKCASGTGEFFLQQIRRMNLDIEKAIDLAGNGNPYAVSGRCSVFCKSDCTHALNKGEPIGDVAAGLCQMIASKINELLLKTGSKRILLVGGTARNRVVVNFLKKYGYHVWVPQEAPYFEALGAALAAIENGAPLTPHVFNPQHTSFHFLKPLRNHQKLVTFKHIVYRGVREHDECILGIDVGSTTTKAVLMRTEDDALLLSEYLRTNGNPVEASRDCIKSIFHQLDGVPVNVTGIGVTGSGRKIAGLYCLTDSVINEIIAHAAAAVYFDHEVDTIFEIGGQDAKYTHLTQSVASDYAMNEACSAGTGSFLEESAFESLGIRMEDIADHALRSKQPPNFNDQCAAFISSDIKNATHESISQEDILAGLVYSVCFNYINRVKGNRPVGKKIFMQGGVCYNRAVPLAMAGILERQIVVPPEPGLMGAYGVALELKRRIKLGRIDKQRFDLQTIMSRKIDYDKPFSCGGGKERCDLRCSINRIRIEGKIYPFGGACNKYYSLKLQGNENSDKLNLVHKFNYLVYEKYAPAAPPKPNAPVIGINTSFLTNVLYPLYSGFFTKLGCRIVLSDGVDEQAMNFQATSMCYPAQIALGLFQNLMLKNPDYVFLPHTQELFVPGGIQRKDFCAACLLVQGEPFWIRQIFHGRIPQKRIISPTLNFNGGWERGEKTFIGIGRSLGFSRNQAQAAFETGLENQRRFEKECNRLGKMILEELKSDPNRFGIVLFGRAYNAYSGLANKGIPKKLTSRGNLVIPYDFLPFEGQELGEDYKEYMHWAAGQRILRAAQLVADENQLFAVYISNFLCAPDSFLITYFRRIMGSKPSLTLELDAHTADAGINTRIEAFLDIIKNYREVQNQYSTGSAAFRAAEVKAEKGGISYIDSQGEKISLKDSRVKLILPSMGDLGNRALTAACRRCGINTEALRIADQEVLRLGRSVTTGKECIPLLICIGSLMKYLNDRSDDGEKLLMFLPKAGGYCRLGQYHIFTSQYIKDRKLKDVALISPAMEENFLGLGVAWSLAAWRACVVSDVLDDIRNSLIALAVDSDAALEVFAAEVDRIYSSLEHDKWRLFYAQLSRSAGRLAEIPLKMTIHQAPEIEVTGEIFVRRDSFSNLNIVKRLAKKGYVVRCAPVTEWLYYTNYMIKNKLIESRFSLLGKLDFYLSDKAMWIIDKRIKKILATSGLCEDKLIDIDDLMRYKHHIIPKTLTGEHDLITGMTLRDGLTKYCGVVSVGPFGCMQLRFSEAVVTPRTDVKSKLEAYREAGIRVAGCRTVDPCEGDPHKGGANDSWLPFKEDERIPFLTIESDGNPYPQLLEARFENFCLQAARAAERLGKKTHHLVLS